MATSTIKPNSPVLKAIPPATTTATATAAAPLLAALLHLTTAILAHLRLLFTNFATLARLAWQKTEKFRDRCFYETLNFLVNPHALVLVLFWPGWVVVVLVWWALGPW